MKPTPFWLTATETATHVKLNVSASYNTRVAVLQFFGGKSIEAPEPPKGERNAPEPPKGERWEAPEPPKGERWGGSEK